MPLSIPEALRGAEVQVPTLTGHEDPARASGHRARHRPAPARRGTAQARQPDRRTERGDIHYRFVIDVPQELSKEQQSAVEQLSKTLGGDPRAGLFQNGARRRQGRRCRGGPAKAGEG